MASQPPPCIDADIAQRGSKGTETPAVENRSRSDLTHANRPLACIKSDLGGPGNIRCVIRYDEADLVVNRESTREVRERSARNSPTVIPSNTNARTNSA
jgi:hypothetical protein